MSDEHKPHDDHGADAGHDVNADTPATPVTDTPEDHGAAADHAGPVVETHDEPAPEPAAPVEPVAEQPHVTHEDAPAVVHDAPEPVEAAHHDDHAPEAAVLAAGAGAAAVTAAASQAEKRPVWSDQGDAPFEDVDTTPVYARGKKAKKGKKTKEPSGGVLQEGWEIIKTIAFALLIALVLRVLLFQPFTIPSASMEPNLYQGDYIVVSKWSYGYSKHSIIGSPDLFDGRISLPVVSNAPKRGDIVVFKLPSDNRTDYIKRLIGMPGDRVQMINNVLHINGQPARDVVVSANDMTNMYGMPVIQADETFPDGSKTFRIQDYGPGNNLDDTPVFEVPAGYYFMMGDNRDNSVDSRVDASQDGVGLVPAENLIGKAEIILFSWNEGASLQNPISWFSKVRLSRWFKVLH